jgi:hypothetical protein
MPDPRMETAEREGSMMTFEGAIAYALQEPPAELDCAAKAAP